MIFRSSGAVGLELGDSLAYGGFVFGAEVSGDFLMCFTASFGGHDPRPSIFGDFPAIKSIPGYDDPESTYIYCVLTMLRVVEYKTRFRITVMEEVGCSDYAR
jgi:hypothetical protein